MKNIFVVTDEKPNGPYSLEEIVKLRIPKQTLAWVQGSKEGWKPLAELFPSEFSILSKLIQSTKKIKPKYLSFRTWGIIALSVIVLNVVIFTAIQPRESQYLPTKTADKSSVNDSASATKQESRIRTEQSEKVLSQLLALNPTWSGALKNSPSPSLGSPNVGRFSMSVSSFNPTEKLLEVEMTDSNTEGVIKGTGTMEIFTTDPDVFRLMISFKCGRQTGGRSLLNYNGLNALLTVYFSGSLAQPEKIILTSGVDNPQASLNGPFKHLSSEFSGQFYIDPRSAEIIRKRLSSSSTEAPLLESDATQKKPNPVFNPKTSKLYKQSEMKYLKDKGLLQDCWTFGEYTIVKDGFDSKEPFLAVPAGSLTWGSLTKYQPTAYQIGWLFDDHLIKKIKKDDVIIVSSNSPAKVRRVDQVDGGIAVKMDLLSPPKIKE